MAPDISLWHPDEHMTQKQRYYYVKTTSQRRSVCPLKKQCDDIPQEHNDSQSKVVNAPRLSLMQKNVVENWLQMSDGETDDNVSVSSSKKNPLHKMKTTQRYWRAKQTEMGGYSKKYKMI